MQFKQRKEGAFTFTYITSLLTQLHFSGFAPQLNCDFVLTVIAIFLLISILKFLNFAYISISICLHFILNLGCISILLLLSENSFFLLFFSRSISILLMISAIFFSCSSAHCSQQVQFTASSISIFY